MKTRFAPSPTGAMHLGNARTALFSWLLARHHGGRFLLRIEDTDRERHDEAAVQVLIDDLRWLGLHWDEGPDAALSGAQLATRDDNLPTRDHQRSVTGSHDPSATPSGALGSSRATDARDESPATEKPTATDNGPYRQSERHAIYVRMYEKLEAAGLTYPCFCSNETLAIQRKTQLAAGRPPRYAGTCAKLNAEEINTKRAQGAKPSMRFRVPAGETITFTDIVHGPQRFATDDIGDFIIRRADGSAAFFFCNAVDDATMGVTHVIRGEDHLTNTPRQMLLLKALGFTAPEYGHVSLILGSDGAPLSKRHGSASVGDLRAKGYLPGAIVNLLARLGHSYEGKDYLGYLGLDALAKGFEPKRLGTAPAHFDEQQLAHWQREAVIHADDATLAGWLADAIPSQCGDSERLAFVHAVRGNVLFPADAQAWAQVAFAPDFPISDEARATLQATDKAFFAAAVTAAGDTGADYAAFITRLKALHPAKGKALFQPLRAALTGRLDGPELASLFALLGADKIKRRLEDPPC